MIGAIEFLKGLTSQSNVEQFKLDKLIFCLKPFNAQFTMIIATDQMTLSNELLIRKKLAILFNLVKLLHGPFLNIDRTDETNYGLFKDRISDITTACYNLVVKKKKVSFDSYYSIASSNLQVKLESRSKYLLNYSMKKLKAFTGLLFYNDRLFSTKIRSHLMINLLYFLTNEESNLIEKCERINDSLSLPSGCHLVKVYLPKRLLNRLINESSDLNRADTESPTKSIDNQSEELKEGETEEADGEESDLVMDVLPQTTRFHSTVSISSIPNENKSDILQETNDFYENDVEQELAVYVQKNSKLKLILISLDTKSEQYMPDDLIRVWQNIVTYFSSLEFQLMEEERLIDEENQTNSIKNANNDLVYSCLIDRNQIIKDTYSKNNQNLPMLMSNMNLYYELIKSMPELSRMTINKKSYTYSLTKQNIATISSSTLQHYSINESLDDGAKTIKNGDKVNIEIVDKNEQNMPSYETRLNYGDILIRCTQNKID